MTGRHKQRGAALLIVLLLAATLSFVALAAMERTSLAAARSASFACSEKSTGTNTWFNVLTVSGSPRSRIVITGQPAKDVLGRYCHDVIKSAPERAHDVHGHVLLANVYAQFHEYRSLADCDGIITLLVIVLGNQASVQEDRPWLFRILQADGLVHS